MKKQLLKLVSFLFLFTFVATNYLLSEIILISDNIKIIDGLGSQAFIPLPGYSSFFAKRYVNRRIQLMWSRIHWDLSGRKGNWK